MVQVGGYLLPGTGIWLSSWSQLSLTGPGWPWLYPAGLTLRKVSSRILPESSRVSGLYVSENMNEAAPRSHFAVPPPLRK